MVVYEEIDKTRTKLKALLSEETVALLEKFIKYHVELHEEDCNAFGSEEASE
jgi:hypothetical protein